MGDVADRLQNANDVLRKWSSGAVGVRIVSTPQSQPLAGARPSTAAPAGAAQPRVSRSLTTAADDLRKYRCVLLGVESRLPQVVRSRRQPERPACASAPTGSLAAILQAVGGSACAQLAMSTSLVTAGAGSCIRSGGGSAAARRRHGVRIASGGAKSVRTPMCSAVRRVGGADRAQPACRGRRSLVDPRRARWSLVGSVASSRYCPAPCCSRPVTQRGGSERLIAGVKFWRCSKLRGRIAACGVVWWSASKTSLFNSSWDLGGGISVAVNSRLDGRDVRLVEPVKGVYRAICARGGVLPGQLELWNRIDNRHTVPAGSYS